MARAQTEPGGDGDAPRPLAAYRLPRGRHGLPRELVAESQRWRLLGAAAEELADRGYAEVTARGIAVRAGVSPATFYGNFEDVDDCLGAAFAVAAGCLSDLVSGACERPLRWPERLSAAVRASLDFVDAEPALAHLLLAEAPAGVPAIAASREDLVAELLERLCDGRDLRGEMAGGLPLSTERLLLGGVFAFVGDAVAAGAGERLADAGPQLVQLLLTPYVGRAEAVRCAAVGGDAR